MKRRQRITTSSTNQCCIIITGRCDILSIPCIRQLSLADGDGLLTGYIWINDKMQCSDRITTGSTYQCGIIITASNNSLSVPCIGQLSLADGDGLLTGYIWINDKMQCSDRITTGSTYQCGIIISSSSNVLSIPCIRQLSLANSDSLLTGYIWINDKMEGRNGIATDNIWQCSIIITCDSDALVVPGIG